MFKLILVLLSILFSSCTFTNPLTEVVVDSASFKEKTVNLRVGEQKQVLFDILPKDVVSKVSVSYSVTSPTKVIEVSNETSNGCVVKGVNNGNCVLVAKCNGLTSYVTVNVTGTVETEPYITLPVVAYEMSKGSRKSFTASLYNGSAKDNALFSFTSSNPEVASIEQSNNTVVVTSLSSGFSRITVTHPKAEYSASLMIYVAEDQKSVTYITTSQNVMQLSLLEGTKSFSVNLMGQVKPNNTLFSYRIAEGEGVVDVIKNNNYFSLTPEKVGNCVIEITHPDAMESLFIQVVVVRTTAPSFIESDKNFLVMNNGEVSKVTCFVTGTDDVNSNSKFSYTLIGDSIDVTQVNNSFVLEALKAGKSKVVVSNALCNEGLEILVMVEDVKPSVSTHYITTSQNLIRTEIGKEEELSVLLTNSIPSDKNSFKWTIDDSSIISLTTSFGTVENARSLSNSENNMSATALITAKKVGIANIKVTHPKSEAELNIKVKVYPKDSLKNTVRFVGPSLVRVLKGTDEVVSITTEEGTLNDETNISWSIDDSSIANINGKGLTALVSGVGSGLTTGIAKSNEVENPYRVSILSGNREEIEKSNVLFIDGDVHKTLFIEDTSFIEIKSTMENDNSLLTFSISDKSVLDASFNNNVLILNAKKKGDAIVTVSYPTSLNTLTLFIKVMDEVSIDKPFFFSFDRFSSLLVGNSLDIKVNLVGADSSDLSDISWEIVDGDAITIVPNGDVCRVTALKEGVVTLKVSSPKAERDGFITVFTALTEAELEQKVVITTNPHHYKVKIGDVLYIPLFINKEDVKIVWECSDISILSLDGSNSSCYIKALKPGNAVVNASSADASCKIYISVVEKESELYEKDISLPLILEMNKGESKKIEAICNGFTDTENLVWSSSKPEVLSIKGNGNTALIKCENPGCSTITIKHKILGIEAKSECIVKDKGDETPTFIMALDKSIYNLDKSSSLDVMLSWGKDKPPLSVKQNLLWEVEDKTVCEVYPSNEGATIKAKNEGITTVKVSSKDVVNIVSFKVIVSGSSAFFYIDGSNIENLITGQEKELKFSLYKNGERMTGNTTFSYEIEDASLLETTSVDGGVYIKAKKSGTTKLHVSHNRCVDSFTVLINIRDTKEEIDKLYPLTTKKDHYITHIGDSVTLNVDTIDSSYLPSDFVWSVSDASICDYEGGGTKLVVKGKKEGEAIFTCTHKISGCSLSFYVYVSLYDVNNSNVSLFTPSIFGMSINKSANISIFTNLSDRDLSNLTWVSNSDNLTVSGFGKDCKITSKGVTGCYEVTVKLNSLIYRTIVVYVCDTDSKVDLYKAHNIDERYKVISVGEKHTIRPQFGYNRALLKNTKYTPLFDNGCVDYSVVNGELVVTGRYEGISGFKVENSECTNSYNIYFEVNKKAYKDPESVELGYLTTTKTVYFLDVAEPFKGVPISINGVGIESKDYSSVTFDIDNKNVATVIKDGELSCLVYPNSKGNAILTVSSPYSENSIEIRIVVGEKDVVPSPFLTSSKDSVSMIVGEENEIDLYLLNGEYYETKVKLFLKNNLCDATLIGDRIYLKAKKSGSDVLSVSYDGEVALNIVLNIKDREEEPIFITTEDNFSSVLIGKYKILNVKLEGYEEKNTDNFSWKVIEGSENITLTPNGTTSIVKGIKEGNAKIMVTHKNEDPLKSAWYPLYLSVQVEKEKDKAIFITTNSNVVTTKMNEKKTITVELENGDKSEYSLFDFSSNSDVVSLQSSQNQCVITPLKVGSGRITVSHPSSFNSLDVIVIVNEAMLEDDKYISTDETVIELSPNDNYKEISVNLVGGKPSENALFSYDIVSFSSTIKNQDGSSNAVIEVLGSGNEAIIKPIREGVATLRVRNEATTHFIDIKVIVTLYNTLKFTTSNITINEGESAFVDVQAPTGKTVIYESENENICIASGTSKKCIIEAVGVEKGKNSSVCVIRAHTSDGASTDEIIVKVNRKKDGDSSYITTSHNVITLNTLTDAKGFSVSSSLNGSNIEKSEEENISWTINGDCFSFASTSLKTIKGKEVTIKPKWNGEGTLVISHPLCKRDKVIYVSVEQNEASLVLSDTYIALPLDNVYSITASLKGAQDGEVSNIVWKTSDNEVCNIITSDPSIPHKGAVCNIKSNKTGQAVISANYGNIVKYVTVDVKEDPILSLPSSSVKLSNGVKDMLYKVEVRPSSLYDQVVIESSSSEYAKVEKVLDHEKKECFIKVSTTNKSGTTVITAKLKNLVSKMKVITSNEVFTTLKSYTLYDKSGRVTETVTNPTSVTLDIKDGKVRVYYLCEPSSATFDNPSKVYSMYELNGPKFNTSTSPFISLSFGKDDKGTFFDIVPKSTGFATLSLVSSSNKGLRLDVPLCIKDKTFSPSFKTTSLNGYSRADLTNGIVNIANKDTISFTLNSPNLSSNAYNITLYPKPDNGGNFTASIVNGVIKLTGSGSTSSAKGVLRSTKYAGTLSIKVSYPIEVNVSKTESFIVLINQEVWN